MAESTKIYGKTDMAVQKTLKSARRISDMWLMIPENNICVHFILILFPLSKKKKMLILFPNIREQSEGERERDRRSFSNSYSCINKVLSTSRYCKNRYSVSTNISRPLHSRNMIKLRQQQANRPH